MAEDSQEHHPDFSEIYQGVLRMEGEQIQSKDLVGREFVIRSYIRRPSKYADNDYVSVQIELSGEQRYFNSASRPLLDQLERTQERLPYQARLVKRKSPRSGRTYLSFE